MTQKIIRFSVILLFIFASLSMTGSSLAMEDAIIAIVNDDVITLMELKEYLKSIFLQMRLEGKSQSEIQALMKDLEENGITKLIEERIMLSEANNIGLEVRQDVVDQRLNEIRSKYNSEQDFLNALMADGATITDLRKKIEDQLKVKFFIDSQVRSRIFVNPQDVTEYYHDHISDFQKKEQVELDSIYIGFGDNPDQARQKMKEVYTLIQESQKEGTSFQEIAQMYSQSPSIGTIERGQLIPGIEEAVFNLNEGDVTEILEISGGYYIFLVKKKIPARMAPLEEVKNQIYNIIFQSKFQERFRSWLDGLKDKAYIDIKE